MPRARHAADTAALPRRLVRLRRRPQGLDPERARRADRGAAGGAARHRRTLQRAGAHRPGHRLPPGGQRVRPLLHRPRGAAQLLPGPAVAAALHAFKIVPGDLGTKGGMRTDARARVLRPDGTAIKGLYAAGNASAAVMGHSYAGAGSTIGPAMTFGYVAANDIADH
ncbi:FAD-binding protein [Actinacidiphila glaucinigra]|uniref:FAD-binding protein n=1 Tax=Actinacidiphila glaucinigra TaxID=235986 RepID=UPI002DD94DED|nr:FAD-binding protein [Actinacidiphila glaucinigra]WSD63344.1 FAD-binding protein [Actinacidiphila glaucinigra]